MTLISHSHETGKGLILSDGSAWRIEVGNQAAEGVVSLLSETMQMASTCDKGLRILVLGEDGKNNAVLKDGQDASEDPPGLLEKNGEKEEEIRCLVKPFLNRDMLALQMMHVASIIGRRVQINGGVLVHGALVEHQGKGVILSGRGGVGKTTACSRLPSPWQAWSDDCTLLVRDGAGHYRAHPWPTWTQFMFGGHGGHWDVQGSLPLKSVFFLAQSEKDRVRPIGSGEAVCHMVNATEEALRVLPHLEDGEEIGNFRLQRFNNICDLVSVVSCYGLELSLQGHFWEEIERVLTRTEGLP